MPVRTGQQFIDGLKKLNPEVWLRGERVADVTTHPAFARPLGHLARLFDLQHDPKYRDILTYTSPTTGDPVPTSFMPAETPEDLKKRGEAFRIVAEETFGLMGRTPDFMNVTCLAFAEGRDVFDRVDSRFGDNMVKYYEFVRENDLFLTHALVPPQTDRSKSPAEQAEEFLHLGLVEENDEGIVVRGARMLATFGPLADEVMVYCLPGLKPHDTKHALAFAVPIDAPGLRQICRAPFDMGDRDTYDHPLSANFEECDSIMVFNDVLIPWDRVFIYNDVDVSNALFPDTNLRNYTAHQTAVRALAKLRLAVGTAMAVSQSVKTDQFLHVQEMLGECLNYVEIVRSCLARSEADCEPTTTGTLRAIYEPLQTIRTFMPVCYPRVVEVIQTLGAGGLLSMPTADDFDSPIGDDIERYYTGAEGMPSEDRVKLYRLAWDLAGDAFGQRALQYERYYAGDPVQARALSYRSFDKSDCLDAVERALSHAGKPGTSRREAAE